MLGDISKEEEKVLLQKAVRILLDDPRLNAWEKEFLASISRLPASALSEKQIGTLNRIRHKCAAK